MIRELEKVSTGRLRHGVRWQAERDTAFEVVAYFELDVVPHSKAVSQPPHSRTMRRFGRFMQCLVEFEVAQESHSAIRNRQ